MERMTDKYRKLQPIGAEASMGTSAWTETLNYNWWIATGSVWTPSERQKIQGAVLRWQRNRTGRPLSPQQIHQKNIWTLSKFHKTTSECWQRTSGTQKSSPLSSKGGRKKYKDKKKDKRGRVGDPSREGSLKKEKFPNTKKHSHQQVCGEPWNLRR